MKEKNVMTNCYKIKNWKNMKHAIINLMPFTVLLALIGCSPKIIKPLQIEYDFNVPRGNNAQYGEPGQNIELTLRNINPNIYNVVVNDSIIVYDKQKPEQFDNLFAKMPELKDVPTTTTTPPSNPDAAGTSKSAKRASKAFSTESTKISDLDARFSTLITTDYNSLKSSVREIMNYSDIPFELNKMSVNCSSTKAQKIAKANAYIIEMLNNDILENQIPVGIESKIKNKIEAVKNLLSEKETEAKNIIKEYEDLKASASPDLTLAQFRVIEENIQKKIDVLKNILDNISKMREKISELEKTKPGSSTSTAYDNIEKVDMNKIIIKTIPRKSADEYLLKVNIEKKVNSLGCINEPTSFDLPVYVQGGVKIDFSTGVIFNFGREKFFDQKYRYDSVYRSDGKISDSVQIDERKNNNISQISIGVFGHIYTRIRRDVNLGGMFGVSLGTDQRVYYHVGLSALIGKNDRLIINSGISFAKSKYIDTQFEAGQIIKRSSAPTTIPQEEATRAGFFIGLSYNLNLIK